MNVNGFSDFDFPGNTDSSATAAAEQLEALLNEVEFNISCGDFAGNGILEGAQELLNKIMQELPRNLWVYNARFYWASLMVQFEASEDGQLADRFAEVSQAVYYKKAMMCAQKAGDSAILARIQRIGPIAVRQTPPAEAPKPAETLYREEKHWHEEAPKPAENPYREEKHWHEEAPKPAENPYREEIRQQDDARMRKIREKAAKYFDIDGNTLLAYKGNSKHVEIPDIVTCIGAEAFLDHDNLISVIIPSSVTTIANSAFKFCTSLNSITIPNSIRCIEEGAFFSCRSLTSITIPSSVTSIAGGAFGGCGFGNLRIQLEPGNHFYHMAGNCLIETATKTLIAGCNNSIIPADGSVEVIGKCAFTACKGLTGIAIPNSVKSIEDSAFASCSALTGIAIPNSVASIGPRAFMSCWNLTSITIPNGVTSIGTDTFALCKSLTHIQIPNSVTSIWEHAFHGCISLCSITIPDSVTTIAEDIFGITDANNNVTSITVSRQLVEQYGGEYSFKEHIKVVPDCWLNLR